MLISALGTSNTGVVTYNVAYDPEAVAVDIDGKVRGFVQMRQNLVASNAKVPSLIERRVMARSAGMGRDLRHVHWRRACQPRHRDEPRQTARGQERRAAAQQAFNVWVDGTLMAHKRNQTAKGDWGSFGMLSMGETTCSRRGR